MNNITKFPKNLKAIKDMDKFRQYCLNPQGIKLKTTSHFEKPQPVFSYLNIPMTLHRAEKPLDEKTVVFRVDPKLTKPEIKQYLEKIYQLDVEKVNTWIRMGKVRRGPNGKKYRESDFKKVYCYLNSPVDAFYQKDILYLFDFSQLLYTLYRILEQRVHQTVKNLQGAKKTNNTIIIEHSILSGSKYEADADNTEATYL